MSQKALERYAHTLLELTGININGPHPWDIQVNDSQLFARIFKQGSLGLGESYIEGGWDCPRLDLFFERVIKANIKNKLSKIMILKFIFLKFFNAQTKKKAREVGLKHYDLGNELFSAMLDKRMNYTCGYWRDANNLDDAQLQKLELTCKKLMLRPNLKVLDIGCGFGALARHAAEKYGVEVVGITISKEQAEFARQNCAGLPVEIRLQDYREVNEKFDRVVSLGMFEHVGRLNYRTYMRKVHECLKDDGLFLLHTIGNNISTHAGDAWITKYIFPNGMLPSIAQIGKASERLLVMEDWHNFGADYDKTLMAWQANFQRHWDSLKSIYDQRFYRLWNYYLLSCAGIFRARRTQLWQIMFSKNGVAGGYLPPRLHV